MELNDLLKRQGIDTKKVLVMRHRPTEPELRRILPWLAAERHDVFNAYQQTQGKHLENTIKKLEHEGYIASFIGHEPKKALFVGLYRIGGIKFLNSKEYWETPAYAEMKKFGISGPEQNGARLWFDLEPTEFYQHWKGKMVIEWPGGERSWCRRSHRNIMTVLAVLEDSALEEGMPDWDKIDISWDELTLLPSRWRASLSEWRGIYYIFDQSDGKGYVGSAYGNENLLGRWLNYAATGHGGNKLLRKRQPENFQFTILQRVSPDMEPKDVIQLEETWKKRLHSHAPYGLNDKKQ